MLVLGKEGEVARAGVVAAPDSGFEGDSGKLEDEPPKLNDSAL